MTIESQIINGTTVLIQEQNDTIWIITLFIALVTLGGIIWSNLQTRKSNKILEMDLKNRLRPFIQITDILPKFIALPNGDMMKWEDYVHSHPKPTVTFVSFTAEIKNLGAVPTLEIKSKWLKKDSEIKRDDLDRGKEDPAFPLGVSESYPLTVIVSWNEYANSKNKPYYFGAKINYQVSNKTEEIGKIWKIMPNTIISEDYWIKTDI